MALAPQATPNLKKSNLEWITDNFLILFKVNKAFSGGFAIFIDLC